MCNSNIRYKVPLIDFARYGTEARKITRPDVLVGEYDIRCPLFKEGDILDANATFNFIQGLCQDGQMFEMLDEGRNKITERLDSIEQTTDVNNEYIIEQIDEIKNAISSIQEEIESLKSLINKESTT